MQLVNVCTIKLCIPHCKILTFSLVDGQIAWSFLLQGVLEYVLFSVNSKPEHFK